MTLSMGLVSSRGAGQQPLHLLLDAFFLVGEEPVGPFLPGRGGFCGLGGNGIGRFGCHGVFPPGAIFVGRNLFRKAQDLNVNI
jgi:hypothetical protein